MIQGKENKTEKEINGPVLLYPLRQGLAARIIETNYMNWENGAVKLRSLYYLNPPSHAH